MAGRWDGDSVEGGSVPWAALGRIQTLPGPQFPPLSDGNSGAVKLICAYEARSCPATGTAERLINNERGYGRADKIR